VTRPLDANRLPPARVPGWVALEATTIDWTLPANQEEPRHCSGLRLGRLHNPSRRGRSDCCSSASHSPGCGSSASDKEALETYFKEYPDPTILSDVGPIRSVDCDPRGLIFHGAQVYACDIYYRDADAALCRARVHSHVVTRQLPAPMHPRSARRSGFLSVRGCSGSPNNLLRRHYRDEERRLQAYRDASQ